MRRSVSQIIEQLERMYKKLIETYSDLEELEISQEFQRKHGIKGWEFWFVPEDWYYEKVLDLLSPEDVVFDVGAGDLRFALLASQKVKKVYAVEVNPLILGYALNIIGLDLPTNLIVICANAWKLELPSDVTAITCLMIHRQHDFPESWKHKRIIYTTHKGVEVHEPLKS